MLQFSQRNAVNQQFSAELEFRMGNIVKEIHQGIKFRECTDHNYPPHFHDELEVIFVLEGSFWTSYNGQEYTVTAGSAFLATAGTIHTYKSPMYSCKTLLLIIDPTLLSGTASQLVNTMPLYPIWHGVEQKQIVWDLILYAYHNREQIPPKDFVLLLSSALSLIVNDMALESVKYKIRTEQKILMYCMEHYREPISLSQTAMALQISESHISHLFGRTLGISFPAYINGLRLNDAVKLLERSNSSIIEIANQAGFASLRSFNHTFLKHYNMTPSQYRKLHKSKIQESTKLSK